MRRMFSGLVATLFMLTLLLSGCTSQQPANSKPANSSGTSTATGSGGSAPTTEKKLTVGVIIPTMDNPFWVRYGDFVKQVGSTLNIELVFADSQNREDKQLSDIESLIARGVDGLLITPQTAAVGPALIQKAEQAGIAVMVTDRYPGVDPNNYSGKKYVGFIGPNDVQAGYDIAMSLIKAGATKIAAINGVQGASVAQGRNEGLKKALTENPNVKLVIEQWVGEKREDGLRTTESYLSARKEGEIDGIWTYNDNLAMGAFQALKAAGRKGVKVGGMDLNQDAVESIANGELTYSTGGHWLQGGFGLVMLHDFIKGKAPKERIVKLNLMGVTKENVQKFQDQFIKSPPKYDIKSLSQVYNPSATSHFDISIK